LITPLSVADSESPPPFLRFYIPQTLHKMTMKVFPLFALPPRHFPNSSPTRDSDFPGPFAFHASPPSSCEIPLCWQPREPAADNSFVHRTHPLSGTKNAFAAILFPFPFFSGLPPMSRGDLQPYEPLLSKSSALGLAMN